MVCLPKQFTDLFKTALKDGTITPAKLDAMTSAERLEMLKGIVGEDNAHPVNALIESKLAAQDALEAKWLDKNKAEGLDELTDSQKEQLLKLQQKRLITAANEIIGNKAKAKADFVTKINAMKDILTPENEDSFYESLAAKKLGSDRVTLEQANKITELAQEAMSLKDKDPGMFGVSSDYLNAQNELIDYTKNLNQMGVGESIGKNAGIIVKNNLILGLSTPIKTFIGQAENYFMDKVSLRLATALTGDPTFVGESRDLVAQANKMAEQVAKETNYRDNVASMESLDDGHVLNRGEDFGVPQGHSDANGVIQKVVSAFRGVAKFTNKVAIDIMHNIMFNKVYQRAMFDAADIVSTLLGKGEGLEDDALKTRANAVFKDAIRIEPETEEGKIVRTQAQISAARITSTNDTWASDMAVLTKNYLNKQFPSFPLGNILEPFAKIPANVIANGLDSAGLGLVPGIRDIFQGYKGLDTDDIQAKTESLIQLTRGLQRVGRVVGTMGLAALIVSKMSPNDFRSNTFGGTFMKIGNTWVNTEYLPIIGPAIAGMALQRQQGGNILARTGNYLKGAGESVSALPDYLAEITTADSEGVVKYGVNFATSYLTPAILKDIFGGGLNNIFSTTTELKVLSGAGMQTVSDYNAGVTQAKKASAAKAKITRAKDAALKRAGL